MFADRTKNVLFSGTLKYPEKARVLRRAGITIRSFGTQPDTSRHIKEAAKKRIDTVEASQYTDVRGLPELRRIFSEKLRRENGIDANPDSEIIVTIGGKQALFLAYMTMINPGDEVIVQDPVWVSIPPAIRLAGGSPVYLPLNEDKEWGIEEGDIENLITPRTKMIVINDPHNPTGTILSKEMLEYIADVAQDHNLIVVSDECYEKIINPEEKHYSIASLPGMSERTVSVFTTTKLYNMYGWRVGFAVADKEITGKMLAIHSHIVGCAPSMAQAGAQAALGSDMASGDMAMMEYNEKYKEARDTVVDGLNKIPKVSCVHGRGGYWVFPNMSRFGMSSMQLHEHLTNYGFVMVPGIEFGRNGEGHIRCTYGLGLEEIRKSLDELQVALGKL